MYHKKVNVSPRTQALVATAAFLGMGIAIGAILLLPSRRTISPADMLPAGQTIAFFADIDVRIARNIEQYVPLVKSLPVDTQRSTFAIIATNQGPAWIRFAPPDPGTQMPIITSSNPVALALVGTNAPSLQNDDAFSSLLQARSPESGWIYLRSAEKNLQPLSPFASPNQPVSMSLSENGIDIAWVGAWKNYNLATGAKAIFEFPAFTLQASNMGTLLMHVSSNIKTNDKLAYGSLLRQLFQNTFGAELSPNFDLLPLLDGQTSLNIGKHSQTGNIAIVIEGTSRNAAEAMALLHKGYRSTIGTAIREQRTFDEKFTSDIIRIDANAIREETTDNNGWEIRRTIDTAKNRGLHSAIKGDRFIVADNADTLYRTIQSPASPINTAAGAAFAMGSINNDAMDDAIQKYLPGVPWPQNIPSGSGGLLQWTMGKYGDVNVLRLH